MVALGVFQAKYMLIILKSPVINEYELTDKIQLQFMINKSIWLLLLEPLNNNNNDDDND